MLLSAASPGVGGELSVEPGRQGHSIAPVTAILTCATSGTEEEAATVMLVTVFAAGETLNQEGSKVA